MLELLLWIVGIGVVLAVGLRLVFGSRAADAWRAVRAIYAKEMRSYAVGPIPYVLVALVAVVVTWWVFVQQSFLLMRQADLESMFILFPILFAIVVPAMAMRAWSEEIRGETVETLMTFPVRVRDIVIGKWLAGITVLFFCLVATAGIPITAANLGNLDMGPVIGGYLGALLMGGAYLAIGLWLSSMTRNQIVAFLVGFVVCFGFSILDWISSYMGAGPVSEFLSSIGTASRFRSLGRGVVDLRDAAYFASFIAFFLYLNVESVENRRCR